MVRLLKFFMMNTILVTRYLKFRDIYEQLRREVNPLPINKEMIKLFLRIWVMTLDIESVTYRIMDKMLKGLCRDYFSLPHAH